jgi:hypothetical protein
MMVSRWVVVLLLVMTGAKKTKSSKDWNSMDEGDWDKVELLAAAVRASGGGMCMIVMRRALSQVDAEWTNGEAVEDMMTEDQVLFEEYQSRQATLEDEHGDPRWEQGSVACSATDSTCNPPLRQPCHAPCACCSSCSLWRVLTHPCANGSRYDSSSSLSKAKDAKTFNKEQQAKASASGQTMMFATIDMVGPSGARRTKDDTDDLAANWREVSARRPPPAACSQEQQQCHAAPIT